MARKSKKDNLDKKIVYEIKVSNSENDKWERALKYCSNLLDIYNKVPAEVKFIVFELGKNLVDSFVNSNASYKKNVVGKKHFKVEDDLHYVLEILDGEILNEMIFVLENFENNYPKEFIDLLLEEKQFRMDCDITSS